MIASSSILSPPGFLLFLNYNKESGYLSGQDHICPHLWFSRTIYCCPSLLQSIGCADAPTTVLAHGPPPLTGRTWTVRISLLCFLSDTCKADFKSYNDSYYPPHFCILSRSTQSISSVTAEIHNILSNNDLPFHPYRITPKEIKPEVPFLCRSGVRLFLP